MAPASWIGCAGSWLSNEKMFPMSAPQDRRKERPQAAGLSAAACRCWWKSALVAVMWSIILDICSEDRLAGWWLLMGTSPACFNSAHPSLLLNCSLFLSAVFSCHSIKYKEWAGGGKILLKNCNVQGKTNSGMQEKCQPRTFRQDLLLFWLLLLQIYKCVWQTMLWWDACSIALQTVAAGVTGSGGEGLDWKHHFRRLGLQKKAAPIFGTQYSKRTSSGNWRRGKLGGLSEEPSAPARTRHGALAWGPDRELSSSENLLLVWWLACRYWALLLFSFLLWSLQVLKLLTSLGVS